MLFGGERLEYGALAQGNRAVLLGMAEPAVAESVELGGDGRGGGMPLHTAVNGCIAFAGLGLVAIADQLAAPVAPTASRLGSLYPFYIQFGQPATAMQRIMIVGAAGGQFRKCFDGLSDSRVLRRHVRR